MNLTELEKKHAELGAEIERLKAQQKAVYLNIGDIFHSISSNGTIVDVIFDGCDDDYMTFAQGNAFRTEEEAISEWNARRVVVDLRNQPGYKKFTPDEESFCLYVYLDTKNVSVTSACCVDWGWQSIYFESKQAAEAAVNVVGKERISKAAKWFAMREIWK